MKKIGLLGGIGPEATGNFYLKLIKKFQEICKPKNNLDYPHIFINSISARDIIYDGEINLESYITGLKELEGLGVECIGIICNTAHCFLPKLQGEIRIPIINLPEKVKEKLKVLDIGAVVVLATPLSIKNGLYNYDGIENVSLASDEVDSLGQAIMNFNLGIDRKKQSEVVAKIAEKYAKPNRLILLGCTEISEMLKDSKLNILDTMDVLTDAVIESLG
jgi:aspartate racemase